MDELINGRTPEEIKRWIDSRVVCAACPNEHEFGCEYSERTKDCQICIDTIAYIERLEAVQPKWISVEDKPEPPQDGEYWCYGYWIGSGRKQAEIAEYLCGEWKIANNFVLTHWMSLPELPKEEKHDPH